MKALPLLLVPAAILAQVPAGLPPGAAVVETQAIPPSVRPNRALILWMLRPAKHDRGPLAGSNPYTCPEYTRGSYYAGPTRVSLLDTAAKKILNSVPIHDDAEDTFDIPYRLEPGHYYAVPGKLTKGEGTPALLALRDLNGDGQALEAAFFDAQACMGLPTTLIGYSVKQDKVIQYPVELKNARGKAASRAWVDYLFWEKPAQAGYWKFDIDYRGRGGTLDSYEVRYDSAAEKFSGTLRQKR